MGVLGHIAKQPAGKPAGQHVCDADAIFGKTQFWQLVCRLNHPRIHPLPVTNRPSSDPPPSVLHACDDLAQPSI